MSDAMAVLHKLQTGLDVNVKFTGVRVFEYTPECIVFDLLDIPLYHGWLVDPQVRWSLLIIIIAVFPSPPWNRLVLLSSCLSSMKWWNTLPAFCLRSLSHSCVHCCLRVFVCFVFILTYFKQTKSYALTDIDLYFVWLSLRVNSSSLVSQRAQK